METLLTQLLQTAPMCSNLPPIALSSLFPTSIDEILWYPWTDGTPYQNEQICILVWSINVCTLWLYRSQGWMLSQNMLWATFCPASLLQMFASKFLGIIVCYRQWVFCKISSLGIIWKFHLALCSSFRSATTYQFPIISYFVSILSWLHRAANLMFNMSSMSICFS